jgi:uncharacterized protein YndB with AHSA1/START domain
LRLVVRELFIDAAPQRVYELLTDAQQLIEWMAPEANVDPRVGGQIRWKHLNGDSVIGSFVELVPARRIVFTYGWDRADVEIPPGSTTVEIDLRPSGSGTALRLVHRGLNPPMADAHAGGWTNYLRRLTAVAEGRDPGPDHLANERVPSAPARNPQVTDRRSPEERFWALAKDLLAQPGITRSTMMGFPCLRLDGEFFASFDRRTGSLVVKLDAARVSTLLSAGKGEPFAPNGRRFREWASVPIEHRRSWGPLIDEAVDFAARRRTARQG